MGLLDLLGGHEPNIQFFIASSSVCIGIARPINARHYKAAHSLALSLG